MKKVLDPDEIFLDSVNLPDFDLQQFEGRLERPIPKRSFYLLAFFFLAVSSIFAFRIGGFQLRQGEALAERSLSNTLRHIPVFAERGIVYDRLGKELAWNTPLGRRYVENSGFGQVVGFIGYPTAEELSLNDNNPKSLIGRSGAEQAFNDSLEGRRGVKIEEVDAFGQIHSEYIFEKPREGADVWLAIDARVQEKLYQVLERATLQQSFQAGTAAVMDVYSGEILALVSVPEVDPNDLRVGVEAALVSEYVNDPRKPFLNRALAGLYPPGSVFKPVVALAALNEGVITPEKKIFSAGSLTVPNPYFPDRPWVFRDWKAHGFVDLREAIALSSDVYFYVVGGGFQAQPGLGISRIEKYARLFGLGSKTGIEFANEKEGVLPSPVWKAEHFPGEPWRVGDTYNTVIGQYGFQVTPLQLVRMTAAVANGGYLVRPTVLAKQGNEPVVVDDFLTTKIAPEHFQTVKEGMRLAVVKGTAAALNIAGIEIAAKTGTAEVGVGKNRIHSLVIGFFPFERPRYAFAAVLENGVSGEIRGAVVALREFMEWLKTAAPEYLD